jgi:hypothetical protein
MEIYVKYKYFTSSSNWTAWFNSTIINDVVANQGKYVNVRLINNIDNSYKIITEVWESDGLFSGADDKVATNSGDPYWDSHRVRMDNWTNWAPWQYNDLNEITDWNWGQGNKDIQLVDGPIGDPNDYDVLTLIKRYHSEY